MMLRRAGKQPENSSPQEELVRGLLKPFVRLLILLRVSQDTLHIRRSSRLDDR